MTGLYVLDGHTPVPADLFAFGRWFESAERHVADARVAHPRVSTVFLGIDHHFGRATLEHVPVLFETMIFGGPHDEYQERYETWDEAEAGHARAVALATEAKP